MSVLEAARAGFPNATPTTELEAIHLDLVRATVLLNNVIKVVEKGCHPLNDGDPMWHDLQAIRGAVSRAQEFTR